MEILGGVMGWDDLRLNQVEAIARTCPDACGADVVSLIAEVRRINRHLVQIHASLAERAETDTEIWAMHALERTLTP